MPPKCQGTVLPKSMANQPRRYLRKRAGALKQSGTLWLEAPLSKDRHPSTVRMSRSFRLKDSSWALGFKPEHATCARKCQARGFLAMTARLVMSLPSVDGVLKLRVEGAQLFRPFLKQAAPSAGCAYMSHWQPGDFFLTARILDCSI